MSSGAAVLAVRGVQPVIRPLMPKGVEHTLDLSKGREKGDVIRPLMPKGVEHRSRVRRMQT